MGVPAHSPRAQRGVRSTWGCEIGCLPYRVSYDSLGRDYARIRRVDPHVETAIQAALGGTSSVLKVGAGTGSYGPPVDASQPFSRHASCWPSGPPVADRAEAVP